MYDDDILDSWNFIIVFNKSENNRKYMLNLDYVLGNINGK